MEEHIVVELGPGWPIVVKQDLIYSQLTDAEFRIVCAYLAKDQYNGEAVRELLSNYDPELVATVAQWVRKEGITRNG
jgi:hypothetical protein